MMERLAAAGVDAALMTPPHLAYRLDAERRTWFQTQMTGSPARRNSDMVPSTLTYALSYENLIFSPSLKGLFVAVRSISLNGVLLICAALCLFCLVLNGRSPPRALASSVLTTGFAAMVLEVLLLFVFQVFQGYVFYAVGLLVAVFMAGLACGGCAGDRLTRGAANPGRLFLGCETALTTSALLVMAFLFLAERGLCSSATALNSAMGSLLFIIGFLTGCEFPLAAAAYWSGQTHGAADRAGGRAAGVVYALDLFGGWFGGIAGALFLFPVLGAYGCCITVAALKGATLIPLALSLRK
jgi:spermidine synthase